MSKKVYELKHLDLNDGLPKPNFNSDLAVDLKNSGSPQRGQWTRGLEFLLSCISMSVGLGNVWRFPYAAYKNGGGAFLIPYLILLVLIGRPMYYMELVLGQFSGRGPLKVWKCVPALKGIGFAQLASNAYLIIFYNYLMALTLYYLFASFQNPLPWSVCDSSWANCNGTTNLNSSVIISNIPVSLAEQYWQNNVLRLSSGLDEITWLNWRLCLCLILSWVLVYLTISKGVNSMGKVAYFTALFPYTVLISLLIVSLTSEGAFEGIKFFFKPQWHKLWDPIVWYRAVEQSFFSLAVCFGTLVMYSSYNDFKTNVYRDAMIISVLDTFTSILAGCVIFAVLGSMAYQQGIAIDKVVEKQGLGLAFVAYPEALSQIKFIPQLWSILFFVMVFTLGIGSSVGMIETILTSIKDEFPSLIKQKSMLALFFCGLFCLLGVPLTTNAGLYMMKLLDNYGVGAAVFMYGISQSVGIMWIYGLRNFCSDIKFMLGCSVGIFWKITWGFTAPVSLIVIFIYGNYQLAVQPASTDNESRGIPAWGFAIGWALACVAVIQVPLWIIITISKHPGSLKQKVIKAFTHTQDWGPTDPVHRQQ